MDPLLLKLTTAQEWMKRKKSKWEIGLMANDIGGTLKCISHERLMEIVVHYRFLSDVTTCVGSFNAERSIHMAFDGESDDPVSYRAALPQGSPLSPILFVISTASLNDPAENDPPFPEHLLLQ